MLKNGFVHLQIAVFGLLHNVVEVNDESWSVYEWKFQLKSQVHDCETLLQDPHPAHHVTEISVSQRAAEHRC